ncbi:MAG: nucleotidyltransferase family protein [Egibacteraceae bacterium]
MAAVAAFGLPNAAAALPDVPLAPTEWQQVVERTFAARLSGHLAEAVVSGAFVATPEQAQQTIGLHRQATWRVLTLERRVLKVAELLEAADIDIRVLKGPALAHTSYSKASLRTFIDVDVLVPADRFDDATAALAGAGYTRPLPQLRPGFDRRFAKTAMFLDSDGLQVDVHRTFVVGPYGLLIQLDDLFATQKPFAIAGHTLKALGAEEQFLNICYHAALGDVPPQLGALRDIAQVLLGSTLDLERVRRLAAAWRGTAVLARAVTLTWETLALAADHPLATWARNFVPERADQRLLACYLSTNRSNSAKYLASIRVIPGLAAKLTYLRALLLPDRTFLERREMAHGAWWHHGAAALLRRAPQQDGQRVAKGTQ